MSDGFVQITERIERAKEQRRDLEIEMRRWADEGAYLVGRQSDTETGYTCFFLAKVCKPTPKIRALISEIIHTLRTSLDNLAYQLFLASRTDPNDEGKTIYFPIYDDSKGGAEKAAFSRIEVLRQEIKDELVAINPSKTANPILWSLHELDIIDKHRRAVVCSLVHHSVYMREALKQMLRESGYGDMTTLVEMRPAFVEPPKSGLRAEVGSIIYTVPPGTSDEMIKKLAFTFDLTFDEALPLSKKSVIEAIDEMTVLTEKIVGRFKRFLP